MDGKEPSIVELLSRKGFYEVLYAVAIEGYENWSNIVFSVLSQKRRTSTSTIRERLRDLVKVNFVEMKLKIKSRNEYTYQVTDLGKKYALSVKNMLEETKSADEKDFLIIDDPKLINEVLEKSIEQGYDSPQDFLREALSKMSKEKRNRK